MTSFVVFTSSVLLEQNKLSLSSTAADSIGALGNIERFLYEIVYLPGFKKLKTR
jgi:hypothetical protein